MSSLKDDDESRTNKSGCKLMWKDLNYYIPTGNFISNMLNRCRSRPNPRKHILIDVAGYAEPGTFLAIIGPSGAGKTTLLNILCDRMPVGYKKGDLTVNGTSLSTHKQTEKYKKSIGYVMQADALLPYLTVHETLLYSGMLTLPRSLSFTKKLARINEVMTELGIAKVAHNLVGNDLVRGISGGEKKRLSIAIELLRSPSILFLDEPTSGLDSQTALLLCQNLARLAHKFKYTVVTTIHQPRSQIFDQFDLLLIMAAGGKQVYFGPASNTLAYFGSEGHECPMHENPADYFIDCVSQNCVDDGTSSKEDSENRVESLVAAWERNSTLKDMDPFEESNENSAKREKGAYFPVQIFWIAYLGTLNEIRNRGLIIAKIILNSFIACVLGLLYFQIGDDQSTIADRNGIIFFLIINTSFNELTSALAAFSAQREVFFRERDSRTYSILAFWIGKQISLLFFQLLTPTIYLSITYWMVGFQNEIYKFFIYFATLQLVGLICGTVGMVLGASLAPAAAVAVSPLYNIVSMIFSGFLVNLSNIPSSVAWLQWLSYGKYAFDALAQNEYNGLTLTCDSDQLVGEEEVCPVTTGEQALENLDLSELSFPINLGILFGFVVFWRLCLLLALKKAKPTGQ